MPRGRPRQFDIDRALDRALKVFWRKGYEGASLHELTRAMGINRPSLYAAFGSKEELFRKALDRYAEGPAAFVREALGEPTAWAVAQRLLAGSIDLLTDRRNPRGCLLVHGALACGEAAESARRELAARRAAVRMADLKNMAPTELYSSGSVKNVTSCTVTTVGRPGRSGIE